MVHANPDPMSILIRLPFIYALLLIPSWLFAQKEQKEVPVQSLSLAYRPAAAPLFDAATGLQSNPYAFPVVLRYGLLYEETHGIGVSAGGFSEAVLFFTDQNGEIVQAEAATTPQVRGDYRWFPRKGGHGVEPYIGAGMVASYSFFEVPGVQPRLFSLVSQGIVGAKIQLSNQIFLELELPLTIFRHSMISTIPGSWDRSFELLMNAPRGQFWPLAGIGVSW
ncbi:MAG: hypothetical protein NWR72_10020 [Bacteroidia bacterium]|nr:hypothetical protein [Bacteroidia bacterium]